MDEVNRARELLKLTFSTLPVVLHPETPEESEALQVMALAVTLERRISFPEDEMTPPEERMARKRLLLHDINELSRRLEVLHRVLKQY